MDGRRLFDERRLHDHPDDPLVLRYLLHAHRGAYDHANAQAQHEQFANRPGFRISRSARPHCQYEVARGD